MSTLHLPLSSDSHPEDNKKVIEIHPESDLNKIFNNNPVPPEIEKLLSIENSLKAKIKSHLVMPDPLLLQGKSPIFFSDSIMVIQGQSGVHKSRVAENICAAFLRNGIQTSPLGFHRFQGEPIAVLYADTERNLKYQLPAAIQKICNLSGYNVQSNQEIPSIFHFTSLIEVDRPDRFKTLEAFIKFKRSSIRGHLVVVIDVITDCVVDFNRPDGSMLLIDMMNKMINNSDCSFLCIIHENPGSDKARGHLGTEVFNKATTVMQVGFVKKDGNTTDVVELKFLKARNAKVTESMLAKYSDQVHTLSLLDDDDAMDFKQKMIKHLAVEETAENLEILFLEKTIYTNKELTSRLMDMLVSTAEAIRKRLREVIEKKWELKIGANVYHLTKIPGKRNIEYTITPVS